MWISCVSTDAHCFFILLPRTPRGASFFPLTSSQVLESCNKISQAIPYFHLHPFLCTFKCHRLVSCSEVMASLCSFMPMLRHTKHSQSGVPTLQSRTSVFTGSACCEQLESTGAKTITSLHSGLLEVNQICSVWNSEKEESNEAVIEGNFLSFPLGSLQEHCCCLSCIPDEPEAKDTSLVWAAEWQLAVSKAETPGWSDKIENCTEATAALHKHRHADVDVKLLYKRKVLY